MEELYSNQSSHGLSIKWGAAYQLLLGAALLSVVPFLVEFSHGDAFANGFYRMAIGGVILLCIALYRKEPMPDFRTALLSSVAALAISLDTLLWNQSVLYIGSGMASVLANLEVVFMILIGAIFFKERLKARFFLLLMVLLVGVYLLALPQLSGLQADSRLGILFAVTASFVYSIYLLLLKVVSDQGNRPAVSAVSLLSVICLLSAAFLGIFMVFLPGTSFKLVDFQSVACVTLNGVLGQVIAWLLITKALKNISLSLSGLLMLAQPALCFIFDCMFLGRNTKILQIIGCIIVLIAIYGTLNLEKDKEMASKEV